MPSTCVASSINGIFSQRSIQFAIFFAALYRAMTARGSWGQQAAAGAKRATRPVIRAPEHFARQLERRAREIPRVHLDNDRDLVSLDLADDSAILPSYPNPASAGYRRIVFHNPDLVSLDLADHIGSHGVRASPTGLMCVSASIRHVNTALTALRVMS